MKILITALLVIPSVVMAQTPAILEPSEKPDWAALRRKAEASMSAELYDPSSAQFVWISGFEWGYVKPLLVKRSWGWVGCVSLNAKNRMGGYVGAEARWFIYSPTDGYGWGSASGTTVSQCSTPGKVPLQASLTSKFAGPGASSVDHLSKLADMFEKGLLTRSEFDAEKGKLIGSATPSIDGAASQTSPQAEGGSHFH